MPEHVAPEYLDVLTDEGTLRIIYEMTVGDMLVCSFVALLILFQVLHSLMRIKWR